MTTLVLASGSRYRRELLERLQLPFEVAVPNVDESAKPGESPERMVERLALDKACAVADKFPDALIIGSDQAATLHNAVLGKPHDYDGAFAQLKRAEGQSLTFYTALCLYNSHSGNKQQRVIPFHVRYRELSDADIAAYLAKEQPFDCAGSAKAEGLGIALIASMSGEDPNALIGLPLIALVDMLRAEGVRVL